MAEILDSLHRLGPRIAVVTDGPEGAYASDGTTRYRVPAYPDPSPPKERTGAGDAFSSALVAALVKGLPLETALAWAPINAMSVVQEVGSQTGLLGESELLTYLKGAPGVLRRHDLVTPAPAGSGECTVAGPAGDWPGEGSCSDDAPRPGGRRRRHADARGAGRPARGRPAAPVGPHARAR